MALELFFFFFSSFLVFTSHKQHFKYAAQKSQVAATDIVFSTRHNNRADKNAASQVYPGTVEGTTGETVQYVFRITCMWLGVFSQRGRGE